MMAIAQLILGQLAWNSRYIKPITDMAIIKRHASTGVVWIQTCMKGVKSEKQLDDAVNQALC